MISLEKRIILTPLQLLPKNVRDLGKSIVAKDFKKLPKVQIIAQSGSKWLMSALSGPSFLGQTGLFLFILVIFSNTFNRTIVFFSGIRNQII